MDDAPNHRKVYARGYYDALRQHGIEKMISEDRRSQILKAQSSLAQKVYEAVPIEGPWSPSFIQSEMQRMGNSSANDLRKIQGCLNTLIESGLIREPEKNVFQRIAVREKCAKLPEFTEPLKVKIPMPTTTTAPQTAKTPSQILASLSARAKKIGEQVAALAEDIDMAQLEIEEMNSAKDADTQKLKQLQQLLKSLS